MTRAGRLVRLPPVPLPPALTARILARLVADQISDLPTAAAIPALEDALTATIDRLRRPGDPPARVAAIGLLLEALAILDAELDLDTVPARRGPEVPS